MKSKEDLRLNLRKIELEQKQILSRLTTLEIALDSRIRRATELSNSAYTDLANLVIEISNIKYRIFEGMRVEK